MGKWRILCCCLDGERENFRIDSQHQLDGEVFGSKTVATIKREKRKIFLNEFRVAFVGGSLIRFCVHCVRGARAMMQLRWAQKEGDEERKKQFHCYQAELQGFTLGRLQRISNRSKAHNACRDITQTDKLKVIKIPAKPSSRLRCCIHDELSCFLVFIYIVMSPFKSRRRRGMKTAREGARKWDRKQPRKGLRNMICDFSGFPIHEGSPWARVSSRFNVFWWISIEIDLILQSRNGKKIFHIDMHETRAEICDDRIAKGS